MRCCFQAPRAVHSYGEPSLRAPLASEGPITAAAPERTEEEADSGGDFGALPAHLLEAIFAQLDSSDRRTHFSVCGVSRTWRAVGGHTFFSFPWAANSICHPSQVFCLSPRPVERSRSGLLQCFVRREVRPASGGLFQFSMYLGKDHTQPHCTHFLMSAVQVSHTEILIYLNRDSRGGAAGHLAAENAMRTRYVLELAPGVKLLGDAYCERGFRQVKVAPSMLGTLQYLAKVQRLMQPRRLEVRLPPPSQLLFGQALPTLCREGGDLEASYHGGQGSSLFRGSYGPPPPAHLAGASATSDDKRGLGGAGPGSSGHGGNSQASSRRGRVGARSQEEQQQQEQQGERPWQDLPLVLVNKPPEWNPELRCWCLNFRGRVKQASIKNFQLTRHDDPSQRTVIQFGKVEAHIFACDFNPTVLTAFQAFCIALSTFGGKFLL